MPSHSILYDKSTALEVIRMQSSVDPTLMAEWIEEFIPSDAYTVALFRGGYGQFSFEVFDIEYEGYFFEYAEICIKYGLFDEAKKICRGLKSLSFKKSLIDKIADLQKS